ncbi:MFS transporter [Microbacterium sp. NPDC089320]|uniref:MFS transporter n=1 Tax=Microbacterium sp. NPDC089320 TaxID=3155182 RepID=UPI00341A9732
MSGIPGRRAWAGPAPVLFMLAWGGNHFTPLLSIYEHEGPYDPWQANLLLGMYVAGLIPGLLVASALSDAYGRRPLVLAGAVAAVAGSAMIATGLHLLPLLCAGRALAGVGVGIAMAVGTSWIKELSSPPFDRLDPRRPARGAARASLTLTLGFGLGAGVTGALGQWAPAPTVTPFVVHGVLTLIALVPAALAPESLTPQVREARRAAGPWWRDLRVPAARHVRFRGVIAPLAPWVFAAAGVAYAIMPAVAQESLGESATIYATVLTVLTLGAGAATQNLVPWLNRRTGGRANVIGLSGMSAGMVMACLASLSGNPAFAFVVALVLGSSYGICVLAGLIQVQAIAAPRDLAGLTGVYYSLTYVGFLLPALLAAALPFVPYAVSLAAVAGVCLATLGVVAWNNGRLHADGAEST